MNYIARLFLIALGAYAMSRPTPPAPQKRTYH